MPPMNPMMGMGMPMMPGYVGYQFPMPGMMDPMGAYPQSVMTGIPPNVGGAPVGKEETVEHKIVRFLMFTFHSSALLLQMFPYATSS